MIQKSAQVEYYCGQAQEGSPMTFNERALSQSRYYSVVGGPNKNIPINQVVPEQ
jgi:hypothetical protein